MKRNAIATLLAVAVLCAALILGCSGVSAKRPNSKKESNTITLSGEEFIERVADYTSGRWKYVGDKPALIDFYADWCAPCRKVAPILEELAAEYADKIYIYKVDVDDNPELAAAFGIRSIPALLFAPMDGEPVMAAGAYPKDTLVKMIEELLIAE